MINPTYNFIPSTCWNSTNTVKFNLYIGEYQNLIIFLDNHELAYLTEIELDFTVIPTKLHGKGVSKNLI